MANDTSYATDDVVAKTMAVEAAQQAYDAADNLYIADPSPANVAALSRAQATLDMANTALAQAQAAVNTQSVLFDPPLADDITIDDAATEAGITNIGGADAGDGTQNDGGDFVDLSDSIPDVFGDTIGASTQYNPESTKSKNKKPVETNFDTKKIQTLDDVIISTQTIGSIARAVGNNMYGIGHTGAKGVVPENRDSVGYAFFTRPQLNLTAGNIRNVRELYDLLTQKENTVQRYTRCILDPRLANTGITSPFVDAYNPFISILSNNMLNMSGWPDIVAPTYTSKEGLKREQWSIVDGSMDTYSEFDMDCTFRNTRDEPLTVMFTTWVRYAAKVFEGLLSPYIDFITENEIDYNTRIYRLVMDETNTYVKKIAATGASFPINVPVGRMFDYDNSSESRFNDQNKTINIRFKCNGACFNDAILVQEFNESVAIFNPDVRNLLSGKKHNLEYIPRTLLAALDNRGIPVIDTVTLELQWYISKDSKTYKRLLSFM